jgi:hypothetical protein
MSLKLNSSGGGSVTLQEPTTASNVTLNLPAADGTVAMLQTPSFATTIGIGGATASTSGSGITFPATQSASSDANTLDDYEEGTWTPSWTAGVGSMTVGSTSASYVKIGKTIHIYGFVAISAASGASALNMSGLPFTTSNSPSVRQIIVAREDQSTGKMGQLFLNNNATTGQLQDYAGSTSVISANWTWLFTGVYQTT